VSVRHNGWLYYAGGDQLWHYSGGYLLAHGDLPPSFVGYGWSVLLLPLAAWAGPNIVAALPVMVMVNTLVLLPIATLCVYGIAARIAGRLFGYFAATLWVFLPYLGILFVEDGYHQKYTELTLPQVLGLSSAPDFPSTVLLLLAAYLCLRALDSASWPAAAGAGLAAGYSIAMKPSNTIFLFAPALLFVVFHRRALLPFAAALAPALLTLALWKYRGLGEFAAAPAAPVAVAAGGTGFASRVFSPDLNSWQHLHEVLLALREHFWAARLIEWLPLAGLVGLLARSLRAFALVGAWFVAYLLLKGTYVPASVDDASFFRILMPAFPAYVLLAASVVLLVPGVRARARTEPLRVAPPRLAVATGIALAVCSVVPLAVVAATPPLQDNGRRAVRYGALVPVAETVRAEGDAAAVRVRWRDESVPPAKVFYRVLRSPRADGGLECAGTPRGAAQDCRLGMDVVGTTRAASFTDHPGAGTWTYRIGITANWLNDVNYGDVTVVSRPTVVTTR
jgi:hypothetical protein